MPTNTTSAQAAVPSREPRAPQAEADRARATTAASRIQPRASSIAAVVIARAPRGWLWRPRSRRMRANTGKAVIAMAVPINRAPESRRWPGSNSGSQISNRPARATPRLRGKTSPAVVMRLARGRRLRNRPRLSSSPTRNMNRTSPNCPSRLSWLRTGAEKSWLSRAGARTPSKLGPRTMPPTISPTTRGW